MSLASGAEAARGGHTPGTDAAAQREQRTTRAHRHAPPHTNQLATRCTPHATPGDFALNSVLDALLQYAPNTLRHGVMINMINMMPTPMAHSECRLLKQQTFKRSIAGELARVRDA